MCRKKTRQNTTSILWFFFKYQPALSNGANTKVLLHVPHCHIWPQRLLKISSPKQFGTFRGTCRSQQASHSLNNYRILFKLWMWNKSRYSPWFTLFSTNFTEKQACRSTRNKFPRVFEQALDFQFLTHVPFLDHNMATKWYTDISGNFMTLSTTIVE